MTRRERVMAAIKHQEADQVPKGELCIEAGLANRLLQREYPLDYQHYERDKAVRELLNIDLINLGDWPGEEIGIDPHGNRKFRSIYGEEYVFSGKSKHIVKPALATIEDAVNYPVPDIKKVSNRLIVDFVTRTDLFVFGQIGGPVSMLDEMLGMEDYLVYCMLNTSEIRILGEKVMEYEVNKAKLFLDGGAQAILVADDIAYNTGPFLPPHIMDRIVYPLHQAAVKEIKRYQNVPVFMHTDGDIRNELEKIVSCGYDGLHSLQPSAGMDIARVKKDFGNDLCLMGNIDLDYIMCFASPDEVERKVKETIEVAAPGGGYILSTCNTLVDAIPVVNALAMYRAGDRHGKYR